MLKYGGLATFNFADFVLWRDIRENLPVLQENKLVNAGGRVAGVTCIGDTLQEAIDKAYAEVKKVTFSNAYYRKDIGQRALSAAKEV